MFVEDVQIQFCFEGIGVDMGCSKEERDASLSGCVSLHSLHYQSNQYFIYENEDYSRGIAIVDEDTIAYGSHDPNKRNEYYIVASKSQRRFLSILYVNEDGNAAPVDFDQENVEPLDTNGFGEQWKVSILRSTPFGWKDDSIKTESGDARGVRSIAHYLYHVKCIARI